MYPDHRVFFWLAELRKKIFADAKIVQPHTWGFGLAFTSVSQINTRGPKSYRSSASSHWERLD
jgi:hypothetical protein